MTDHSSAMAEALPALPQKPSLVQKLARNTSVKIGLFVVVVMMLIGLLAPFLGTINPSTINPASRNKFAGHGAHHPQ